MNREVTFKGYELFPEGPKMKVSGYLYSAFSPVTFKNLVDSAVVLLKPRLKEFDGIAVRGTSGLLMGPILSMMLEKPLIVVRKSKEQEPSHASYMVEAGITEGRYLIVDDTVATGHTLKEIGRAIQKDHPMLKSTGFVYIWCNPNLRDYSPSHLKEFM